MRGSFKAFKFWGNWSNFLHDSIQISVSQNIFPRNIWKKSFPPEAILKIFYLFYVFNVKQLWWKVYTKVFPNSNFQHFWQTSSLFIEMIRTRQLSRSLYRNLCKRPNSWLLPCSVNNIIHILHILLSMINISKKLNKSNHDLYKY